MSVSDTIKVDAHLWKLDIGDHDRAQLERLLNAEERAHAARFFQSLDAKRWTVSRARMRQALGAALERDPAALTFCEEAYGRPNLDPGNTAFSFNLSHSGGMGCLAISWQARIGIDIEQIRQLSEDEMNWPLSKIERSVLAGYEGEEKQTTFFRFWTLKEAFMKADGRGASLPTDSFDVGWNTAGEARLLRLQDQVEATALWRFSEHTQIKGYAAAVAAQTSGRDLSVSWHEIC